MVLDLLYALSITLLVEPIIVSSMKRLDPKLFLSAYFLNVLTNLTMNGSLLFIDPLNYWLALPLFEAGTLVLETLVIVLINKTKVLKTFAFVFLANLASLALGLGLNRIPMNRLAELIVSVIFLILGISLFLPTLSSRMAHREEDNQENAAGNDKGDDAKNQ